MQGITTLLWTDFRRQKQSVNADWTKECVLPNVQHLDTTNVEQLTFLRSTPVAV